MADHPELGRRLRDAKREYEKRHDVKNLSWREIGERVGAAMGREPVSYQVVQRWFMEGREPAAFVDTIIAIAEVLETDPRLLTFGLPPKAKTAPRDDEEPISGDLYVDAEAAPTDAAKRRRRGSK